MSEGRRIVELDVGSVGQVEGLWKEMRAHHVEVTGGPWPARDPEESWRMRRAQYVGWLESGEAKIFVVVDEVAEDAAVAGAGPTRAPLGYACLRVGPSGPTWDLGEVVGDLESLSVAAAARGTGVGSALIAHCREHLVGRGARWWSVSVVAGNDRAAALYAREGFRPNVDHLLAPLG